MKFLSALVLVLSASVSVAGATDLDQAAAERYLPTCVQAQARNAAAKERDARGGVCTLLGIHLSQKGLRSGDTSFGRAEVLSQDAVVTLACHGSAFYPDQTMNRCMRAYAYVGKEGKFCGSW